MTAYEELAGLTADEHCVDDPGYEACSECGSPTTGDLCRRCGLLAAIGLI